MKVPVELVGLGRLGEVALLVCIEQQCPTARLCNLVFMPPWFSTVVYKVKASLLKFISIHTLMCPAILLTCFVYCNMIGVKKVLIAAGRREICHLFS